MKLRRWVLFPLKYTNVRVVANICIYMWTTYVSYVFRLWEGKFIQLIISWRMPTSFNLSPHYWLVLTTFRLVIFNPFRDAILYLVLLPSCWSAIASVYFFSGALGLGFLAERFRHYIPSHVLLIHYSQVTFVNYHSIKLFLINLSVYHSTNTLEDNEEWKLVRLIISVVRIFGMII